MADIASASRAGEGSAVAGAVVALVGVHCRSTKSNGTRVSHRVKQSELTLVDEKLEKREKRKEKNSRVQGEPVNQISTAQSFLPSVRHWFAL